MAAAVSAETTADGTAWHAIPVDEVLRRLTTSAENGLDAGEASARLQKYGPNRLPEGGKRGPFMRFIAQFNNILVYVLLGAGFTKMMLGLWVDAAIILGVVVINGLLGFIQEGRAEKALDSIRNMLSAEARTLRGGATRMLPADAARAGRRRAARIGRQGAGRPPARRCQEPADRGSGAHRRVGASGQDHRSRLREGDGRGSRKHGVLRHHGRPGRATGWSSGPAARRSWAASTSCSPASARSRRRCCARSRSSATPSPPSSEWRAS